MKYERYTKIKLEDNKEYTIDKNIFSLAILSLVLIFLGIVLLNGGLSTEKNYYIYCETEHGGLYCDNPMYLNYPTCTKLWANACEQKTLLNGFVYGTPPPRYFLFFNYCVFIILVLAFTLNHYIHNRHLKLKEIKTGLDK